MRAGRKLEAHGTGAARGRRKAGGTSTVGSGGGGSWDVAGRSPCLLCDLPRRPVPSAAGVVEARGSNCGSPLLRLSMPNRTRSDDAASNTTSVGATELVGEVAPVS